jgi:hypothetical protein
MRENTSTSKPFSLTLEFDGETVGTVLKPTNQEDKWVQISGKVTVKGTGPHTVSLDISSKGARGEIFAVDDFSVKAVEPPVGTTFCST